MKEGNVLRTFEIDKELYDKFKILLIENDEIASVVLRESVKDYVNKHTIYKKIKK